MSRPSRNTRDKARTLIYIPIIHSQADLGGFAESVRRATLRKQGLSGWKRKEKWIERYWLRIEKAIEDQRLAFAKVHLYQDGLPVCGREAEMAAELAGSGSRNYQLLLRLMDQGATLIGTESPELLVQEYELFKTVMNGVDPHRAASRNARFQSLSAALMQRRDQYMADRIHHTLGEDETGILFLGALHSVEKFLPEDIRIIHPIQNFLDHGKRAR